MILANPEVKGVRAFFMRVNQVKGKYPVALPSRFG